MQTPSKDQLEGGLAHLERIAPQSVHTTGLRSLIRDCELNPLSVTSFLQSSNAILRKYGVVGAARAAKDTFETLLCAASLLDEDVKLFLDHIKT